MRLRNIPGSREVIASSPFVIHEDVMREKKGTWHEIFGNNHPIYLEIGMGKGRFISDLALLHPENNYVGIEKYSSVLLRAIQKREDMENVSNLYFLRMEAEDLNEVFAENEVAGIYLNFSDPWPKDRHRRRRLESREFLSVYFHVLIPGGKIEFKTDNDPLFSFALGEAEESGWPLEAVTWDLHHDEKLNAGNIMTEYEERFSTRGNKIHKMIITRPAVPKDPLPEKSEENSAEKAAGFAREKQ